MALFWMINTVSLIGGAIFRAGQSINDAVDPYSSIVAAGGYVYPQGNTTVDAAALVAQNAHANRALNDAELTQIMEVAVNEVQDAAGSTIASRNINTTAPLVGGGNLLMDRTLSMPAATPTSDGFFPQAQAGAVHPPVASHAALKAIVAAARADGMFCMVLAGLDGSTEMWRFSAASTAADTSENLVVVPTAGTGVWLRADKTVALWLPVTFANADASVIFTMPTGAKFKPRESWWDVVTSWTGGSSSAIGVHCSATGYTTKGDLLGGASGDIAATLVGPVSGRQVGTIGAKLATRTTDRLIMIAADTLLFDQITSTFSAGAANVRVMGDLLSNPGA